MSAKNRKDGGTLNMEKRSIAPFERLSRGTVVHTFGLVLSAVDEVKCL